MKKIIAKINFALNGVNYIVGEELNNLNYSQIAKLNEKGFIQPLKYEDLVLIKRELDNPKSKKEEQ